MVTVAMKIKMCSRTGCQSMAKWGVGFKAYAAGHNKAEKNSVSGHFNLYVCDSHKNALTVDDVISDEGWSAIQQAMFGRGKALLDRNTIEICYNKIVG